MASAAVDVAYAHLSIDQSTQAGYHAWAKPLVRLLERSRLVTAFVRPFGAAWVQHMALPHGDE